MTSSIDRIYRGHDVATEPFRFDEKVATVFNDMIRRSVPGYPLTLSMLAVLADTHARPGTRIYDLGCSLGAGLIAMAPAAKRHGTQLIGIDNSPAMLQRCRAMLAEAGIAAQLACADIRDIHMQRASMVVMNFTLQFIPPGERDALLRNIRCGLEPGGILVLSEKIEFPDPTEAAFQVEMHHAFKRMQGYSELEISRKRAALEHVLVPETRATHLDRLRAAGFARAHVWFQCFNFMSLVAVADG
ncbi:MAG: carboxy-S-adenosyl-L-methionine synthase CmoA [Zetaproteobacteria bacterium]|nr:MAG: carboxy-S-adenosyl-L-methionine synthase CmoA [Zetaproteobacteria bacterium]